jgi:RNA polymerase sigma-70 factor (ECF subfamily)
LREKDLHFLRRNPFSFFTGLLYGKAPQGPVASVVPQPWLIRWPGLFADLKTKMSTPPQGRAMTFPMIWNRSRARSGNTQDTAEPRSPSDEELIARLQEKDSGALEILFARYSRLVHSIALRTLHDYGEAEDVVQEEFFYLYEKAALFDPAKGTAKSWIVQTAFHRALDRKGYLGRRGFYVGTEIDSLDETLLGKSDLDRAISGKLSRERLEEAVKMLPEMQRRTIEMFYFEGLELREISEKLNEPWGNIRHHFYRGLERLRKSAFVRKLQEK